MADELEDVTGMKVEIWHIDQLIPYDRNPRKITPSAVEKVARSIKKFGFNSPIIVDEEGVILAGHTRREALIQLGATDVAVIVKFGLTEQQKRAYRIADNRVAEESEWDDDLLKLEMIDLQGLGEFDMADLGFDGAELNKLFADAGLAVPSEGSQRERPKADAKPGSLSEKFGIPPFSVLDATKGWWFERRKAWLATGIDRMGGRGSGLTYGPGMREPSDQVSEIISATGNSTSTFDPVLCELIYRWFCPKHGLVLDPFAGGPTSGIVASRLGRAFHGVDIRQEQVDGCVSQLHLAENPAPTWYCGDSRELDKVLPRAFRFDLVFSCPPYADLERYSDDPADLSTMDYADFLAAYRQVIESSAALLRPNRFFVFVVGDVRMTNGSYLGLPWHTVEYAEQAGLQLYNEAVLLPQLGSLALRAGMPFERSRKLGKSHQNVLIFIKGDAKVAALEIGPCEFGEVEGDPELEVLE